MGSPWRDVTGVGKHLRPSDTDLGKGKTTKEDEIKIKALMGPRAKHHLRPQDGSHRLIVNV